MRPLKGIPYYYRASGTLDQDDIIITILITINRFNVFSELVKRHQGPISASVHIKLTATHEVLDALHDLYTSTSGMSTYVGVCLVLTPFDRQLNTWRNVARLFARTGFVMMLDVEFTICTDFRSVIRSTEDSA